MRDFLAPFLTFFKFFFVCVSCSLLLFFFFCSVDEVEM